MDTIGKKYHRVIVVNDSLGNSDGFYKNGDVYISLDTKGGYYLSVLGHELYHSLDTKSSDEIREYVINYLENKAGFDYDATFERYSKIYDNNDKAFIEQEITADNMFDVFDENTINSLVKENKTLAQKILDFLNELFDFLTGSSQFRELTQQIADDTEYLDNVRNMFLDALEKNITDSKNADGESRLSVKEIVDDSGNNYGVGVYLDSNMLSDLTDKERKQMVKLYVTTELTGKHFTAFDNNKNPVDVMIANKNDKITTKSGNKKPVIKELYNKNIFNNIKQEAVVLVDELVETAKFDTSKKSAYSHGWIDNNGNNDWDYWNVYIQEKNKAVWIATLNIANTANGEKVLYDIDPINIVTAGAIKSAPTTATNNNISQKNNVVNSSISENSENDTLNPLYDDNVRNMFLDALEKNNTDSKNADGESRYAIKYTTDNVPVVVIDENILDDVPKSKWVQKVKNTLISKYSGGINIWNGVVKVNAISRNEFVNSKYTKYIKAIDKDLYRDKLLTANNIEEILKNSYNKKIEDLNHARNDSFKQFAHSDVLIKIGNNTYSADVVVGISSKNALVFYDIIDLKLTDKKIKTDSTEGSAETATNLFNREPIGNNISQKNNVVNSSISGNSENDALNPLYDDNVRNMFLDALEKNNTDSKNADGESRYALNENLNEQLDKWIQGKMTGDEYFDLGTTPDILIKHGAAKLPVIMTQDTLIKCTGGKHSISLDEISKLPYEINNPTMLFNGSVENSFVVLTELTDKDGNDLVAAIHLNKWQNRLKVNRIASFYGRKNIENYVKTNIENGNLIDVDTKKAPIWFTSRGLQLPKLVQTIIDANNNISQKNNVVNSSISGNSENDTRFSKNTDSDGNSLTEQQDEYFKNSKVRDEDGNLLVVYHGSPYEFTIFDKKRIGSETDAGSFGRGFYFSPNYDYADLYTGEPASSGTKTKGFYLNIANPYEIQSKKDFQEFNKIYLKYANEVENNIQMNSPEFDKLYTEAINKGNDELVKMGYDGVYYHESSEEEEYIAFNSNQAKLTDNLSPSENEDIRYALNEKFKKEFDEWDKIDANKNFIVGTTSDALLSIGMKNQQILMRSGMILNKTGKHSEITFDTFRQIPELLENPIVVQFSDAIDPKTNKPKYDSRITVLGELYADMVVNGKTERKPVLVSLELLPTNQSKTKILNISVVTSAYTKNALQQYINENSILYVEPNKKRTNNWLSLNRLSLPVGENQLGSIKKITYSDGKVKIENSKNATSMQIALQKAGIVDSFGNSISENSENDTRFSKNTDSDGNSLTEQQDEYFKNSKVRDENGNLLKVYHGTTEDFTVFDKSKGRSTMDIQGNFFSPWEIDAKGCGKNVKGYYLNITNPASEAVGYKVLRMFQGQNNAGVKAREYLEKLGYDGVNNENEKYIAFNSNQIKLVDNLSPPENEDIRYSKKEDFSVQVDNVISNKFDYTNTHILVCDTPNALIDVGLKQKPMLVTAKHIYSMTVSEEQAKKDGKYSKNSHYHNLGADIVKQLPKALSEPICVIKSNADDNNMDIVIVTELIDKQNNPVIAAIKIDGKGNYNNVEIDSNIIKSAYGRTNFTNYMQRAIDDNRVLIFDKKRSQNLTNTPGVQFPDNIGSLDFNNNLSHYKEIVNTYYARRIWQ